MRIRQGTLRHGTGWLLLTACLLGCQRGPEGPFRVVPQVLPLQPRRVEFAAQGEPRLLVVEASGLVTVWNIADLKPPVLFASIPASAIDARFAPDGRQLATVGMDGQVRWWSIDGRLLWTSRGGHHGWARAVGVSGHEIVSGGEDGTIRLWNFDGASIGKPLAAHAGAVLSVDLSPQGDLVSLGADEIVQLWQRDRATTPGYTGTVLYKEPNPRHVNWLPSLLRLDVQWGWDRAALFSPRGDRVAAVVFDGLVRQWTADGTPVGKPVDRHNGNHVRALAYSPRGDLLASAGFNGGIQLWNADGSPHGSSIDAHRGPAESVAFAPSGEELASAGIDDRIRFWNVDGARVAEFPRGHGERVRAVAFSPHAAMLAVGEANGTIRLWNVDGSAIGPPLTGHRGAVLALAFSPRADLLVSAGRDGTVRLWNLDGTPRGQPLKGHVEGVASVAIAPDGTMIASGSRNDPVRLWAPNGQPIRQLVGLRDIVTMIAFSPTQPIFAAADAPGEIQFWNLDGSPRMPPLKAHVGIIYGIAFSPSGDVLASGGADGLVKLWNLDGSPRGTPLSGHIGPVQSVAYAPSGRLLASGGADGTLRVWNLPPDGGVRSLLVGVPVNQVGFIGNRVWVRANGETIFFFDTGATPAATMVLRRNSGLVFTRDGWFSGTGQPSGAVRVFDAAGQSLHETEVRSRLSPQHVRSAILGEETVAPSTGGTFPLTAPTRSR